MACCTPEKRKGVMMGQGRDKISGSALLGQTKIGSKMESQILSLFKMLFGSSFFLHYFLFKK